MTAAIDLRAAMRVAAVLTALTAATALATHLAAADDARRLLDFGFGGIRPTLDTAASIFANNVRVLGAVLAAAIAVQLAHSPGSDGWERAVLLTMRGVCDAILVLGCTLHVLLIGAAYGAYGTRVLSVTIAHAPGELAAFSLVLALYLRARNGRAAPKAIASTTALAVFVLALAALLETFA